MEASARGRGLARHLPGHFVSGQGIRMGDHVLPLQGAAPSGDKARNLEKTRRPKALWSLKRSKRQGTLVNALRSAEDSNKTPSKVGSLGKPLQKPDGSSGTRTETAQRLVYVALWLAHHVSLRMRTTFLQEGKVLPDFQLSTRSDFCCEKADSILMSRWSECFFSRKNRNTPRHQIENRIPTCAVCLEI